MGRKKGARGKHSGPKERVLVEHGYIPDEYLAYYKDQLVPASLTEEEFERFVEVYRTSLPHVFRLLPTSLNFECVKKELLEHIEKIRELGYDACMIDYLDEQFGMICKLSIDRPSLKKKEELAAFREWLHIHTEAGDIARQEFVSMLPPFFLDVQPTCSVLDCCASPGSKTTQILERLEDGLLVANDIDLARCHTLVHQLNRLDTSKALVTTHPAQYLPDFPQFDRVLCDVPCSGDGTFRKNPDATKKWTTKSGLGLHSIQRSVLLRGLQLLKVGGICVYSTCSLNPIEDEAVINSVLNDVKGAVSTVDCSSMFPALKRSKGLPTWKVIYEKDTFEKAEDVPEHLQKSVRATMFPTDIVDGLEHCMRFYPHQNDSGGFFVTVLRKTAEFEAKVPQSQSPAKEWKEFPYVPLTEIEGGKEIMEEIIKDYGMTEAFNPANLFARGESAVNNIFYLTNSAASVVRTLPPKTLRAVLCGTRILTHKTLADATAVKDLPCAEGINILTKFSTKRTVSVTPAELKGMLLAGNDGLRFEDMTEHSATTFKSEPIGGIIVTIKDSPFVYGGMRRTTNVSLQVKKERIPQELFKLSQAFPDI